MLGAGAAQAAPTTALYLTMDGSDSIVAADFTSQVTAYNAALTAFFTANPVAFGQVAIGGAIFGADFQEFFAPQTIIDGTVLTSLETAISNLDPGRLGINGGSTAIGDALTASAASLVAFNISQGGGLRLIIDVTTDGENNFGSDPATVATGLVPGSVAAVNCLGIGASANCSFVAGAGTDFGSVSFANLDAALTAKIQIETTIPEPAKLLVVGVGVMCIGVVRRKRA
ncbi:MAG: DUF1194 domain-containing protein [Proteobacteria bacterium]|nr:DUF1194 domain-containing protein [Pseudomonadota bacterium]